MPFSRLTVILAVALPVSLVATAMGAEPPIVAKARAYLGPEAALNGVKSVHYVGSMLAPNAADPAKPIPVAIDIIIQAPYRQRLMRSTPSVVDTTALDGYDCWNRMQEQKNPTKWRLQLLGPDQIRRQRATVWENLAFYRGLEQVGGKVLDQGAVTVEGVACRKLAFVHAENIIFYRYFDETSGRLVLTETESGSSIRELGEIMVNGLRFPRVIVNTLKGADGKEQTITITFDQITVNESFPASIFAVPSFAGQ